MLYSPKKIQNPTTSDSYKTFFSFPIKLLSGATDYLYICVAK